MSALFTMPGDADFLNLKVETATDATTSYYIDDFALSYAPPLPIQTDIPSLKDVLADSFTVGAAVDVGEVTSARHSELTRKHYDTITPRFSWKFAPIHPSENTYNFGPADTIANFARQNGLKVRGHALVWHQDVPAWLFQDASGAPLTPTPESKELVLQRLESHIRTVVARYADVVTSWDVVNEVVDPAQPDGLRRTPWLALTGTDYIDRAFQVAREWRVRPSSSASTTTAPPTRPNARLSSVSCRACSPAACPSTAWATRCTSTSGVPRWRPSARASRPSPPSAWTTRSPRWT
jgi:endo-1,4-beta-xylanase